MNWIKQHKLIAAAIGLLIVAAIGGGIWYYRKRQGQLREAAGIVPEPTAKAPSTEPTASTQAATPPTKEELLAQQVAQNAAWQKVGLWHEVTEAEAKAAEGKPALPKAAAYKPFFGFLKIVPTGQTVAFDPLNDRQIKAMWEKRKRFFQSVGATAPSLKKDTPFIQAMARNIYARFGYKTVPNSARATSLSIIPDPVYFKELTFGGPGLSGSQRWYELDNITKLITAQL